MNQTGHPFCPRISCLDIPSRAGDNVGGGWRILKVQLVSLLEEPVPGLHMGFLITMVIVVIPKTLGCGTPSK